MGTQSKQLESHNCFFGLNGQSITFFREGGYIVRQYEGEQRSPSMLGFVGFSIEAWEIKKIVNTCLKSGVACYSQI